MIIFWFIGKIDLNSKSYCYFSFKYQNGVWDIVYYQRMHLEAPKNFNFGNEFLCLICPLRSNSQECRKCKCYFLCIWYKSAQIDVYNNQYSSDKSLLSWTQWHMHS